MVNGRGSVRVLAKTPALIEDLRDRTHIRFDSLRRIKLANTVSNKHFLADAAVPELIGFASRVGALHKIWLRRLT